MGIYCTTLHIQHTRVTMVEGMKYLLGTIVYGGLKKLGGWDHRTLSMIAPFPLWKKHTDCIHHSQWSRSKMGLLNFSTIQCCSQNSTFIQLLDILVYFPIEFGVYQQTIGSYSDSCFCNQWQACVGCTKWNIYQTLFVSCHVPLRTCTEEFETFISKFGKKYETAEEKDCHLSFSRLQDSPSIPFSHIFPSGNLIQQ